MIWMILGPISSEIIDSFAAAGFMMTMGQKSTLLSLPILSGALLRIVLGFGVDKLGAKKTALIAQSIVIVALFFAYSLGTDISYNQLLFVAVLLGFAGASFSVALPQAGQWYPPKLQGFGVFLKLYLTDTYPEELKSLGFSWFAEENIKVMAGYFGALFVFAGRVLRPIGGAIADKIGGIKALYIFFSIVVVSVTMIALLPVPFLVIVLLFFITMANLGMANGAVFQLVPQRFSKDIGVMVGIVGAAGGLGGTALIKTLGWSKGAFDGYMVGFLLFAGVTLVAIAGLSFVKTRWRTTWGLKSGGMI